MRCKSVRGWEILSKKPVSGTSYRYLGTRPIPHDDKTTYQDLGPDLHRSNGLLTSVENKLDCNQFGRFYSVEGHEISKTPERGYVERSICAAVLALLVLFAGRLPLNAQARTITVPPAVSKLLIPVLDAYEKGRTDNSPTKEEPGGSLWNAAVLAGKVMSNKTPAADEALVVLLYFYIGEATDGDKEAEIIDRGKKMLPYLKKYQTRIPQISGRDYRKLLLERETSQMSFKDIIAAIERGDKVENDRIPAPDSR
jgi:hypothetical protein